MSEYRTLVKWYWQPRCSQ